MIPFIRSLSELMAITNSWDDTRKIDNDNKLYNSKDICNQKEQVYKGCANKEIELPALSNTTRRKWIKSREAVSKFFDKLDYNNQIQSSYELTLLARQNNNKYKDVA
tara:strand:- start:283 stop:603 length:321 start_codon:yes stop_codon:yes gene_type:complete